MYIVHVTPIVKSKINRLSYFSSKDIPVGTIVNVPLRNKEVPALVLEQEDARAIKSILRTNVYETRKIRDQKSHLILSAEFMRAAHMTAQYFATATGNIVQSYVPAAILDGAETQKLASPSKEKGRATNFEKFVLQLPQHERIEKYKTIIRSQFAQGHSVVLCVSTTREAQFLKDQYTRGIEQYTFILESTQTKKKQRETWNAILTEKHPVLIIATPTFLSIPRNDVGMYIIENEMSSSFKQQTRPHADARVLVEFLARETKSALVYAGTTVSVKVHKELQEGSVTELEEHTRKLRTGNTVHVLDVKPSRIAARENRKPFPAVTSDTLNELKNASEKGKRSFIFASRRGIATHTVCNDCNTTVRCQQCASPMVLHERSDARELLCHRCGSARDAHETCMTCGSWHLVPLGIGINRIEQYVQSVLPDTPLFVFSSDTVKTPRQAHKLIEEFYATKGAVLLGTEMSLPYLTQDISLCVISSLDSLLSIPDFRIEEKLFGIIARLRERTKDTLLIETSSPDNTMLAYAQSGSIDEYIQEELQLRKQFHYPPYTHLIKVMCHGPRDVVIRDMQKFIESVRAYKPRVFRGFIPALKGTRLHALIRIPEQSWPDNDLVNILESLSMSFDVDVDPERTL